MHDHADDRKTEVDDQVDPAPTTDPDEAGEPDAEPQPAAKAKQDAKPDEDAEDKEAGDHRSECEHCKGLEAAINDYIEGSEIDAGCRIVTLMEALAKACCDSSENGGQAFGLGNEIIRAFKREVENIMTSDDYAERTGTRAFLVEVETASRPNVSPLVASYALSLLQRGMRF